MTADRVERRLAAILAADVAGYSRLMGADEEGTLARLTAHRRELFEPAIASHRGRVVKTTGDGLLAEFASVVDAVRCAAQVQAATAERNTTDGEAQRLEFRIGINVGDIIEQDGDIFGDGVNIAARLEAIADPGGICVSARVQEDAGGKSGMSFEDLGEQVLKNIARPIRAYRMHTTGGRPPSGNAGLGLPDTPALAVLPFQNMSGDVEQEYFADGVVEDIITALSRFRSFAVIARNSSFVYKGRAADVRQVARELGVRYVLEGSIRRAATRLRITAQLVEGATGAHLWAEHYDGSSEDVFDFQDRITESVVSIVEPHIKSAEIARSRRERPESIKAYDLYLQSMGSIYSGDPERNVAGLTLIERAIALEPGNALYLASAVVLLMHRAVLGWKLPSTRDERALCSNYIERALSNGHGDAVVAGICGNALIQQLRQYDRGFELVRQAVAINPNHLDVVNFAGVANLLCGSLDEAVTYFLRAERLSPNGLGSHWNLSGLAHVELVRGNCEQALLWAGRSMAANASFGPCFWMLIAANARLGRMEEAQRHLASLLAISPGVTVASIRAGQAAKLPDRIEPILEGLLLAGMPEV